MEQINSFLGAMKHYFGTLPGQSVLDFGKEVKALSADDRAFYENGLRSLGYNIPVAA
jgi:hypothetical protein